MRRPPLQRWRLYFRVGDYLFKVGDYLFKVGDYLFRVGHYLLRVGVYLFRCGGHLFRYGHYLLRCGDHLTPTFSELATIYLDGGAKGLESAVKYTNRDQMIEQLSYVFPGNRVTCRCLLCTS
jgi:hypothetical protein